MRSGGNHAVIGAVKREQLCGKPRSFTVDDVSCYFRLQLSVATRRKPPRGHRVSCHVIASRTVAATVAMYGEICRQQDGGSNHV